MVVFVKMFDDKLVIESPGGFPPPVTPETIYDVHSPRNPHTMGALFFLDLVKCHNEGTRRIRDSMDEMNLPRPEFCQKQQEAGFHSVRVTLHNNFNLRKVWIDSEAGRLLGPAFRDLKQSELRLLNFVAENGSINVSQAHRLLPKPKRWHTVKKLLQGMVERGLLIHHHSETNRRDPNAHYTLAQSAPEEKKKID
jgi:ATP-dependent DNA helicase RecG